MKYFIVLLLLAGCKDEVQTITPKETKDIVYYTPGDCYRSEFLDIPGYPVQYYVVLGQGKKYKLPDDSKVIVIVKEPYKEDKFYTSYYLDMDGETLLKKECQELFPELKINGEFVEKHLQYFLRNRKLARQHSVDFDIPFEGS